MINRSRNINIKSREDRKPYFTNIKYPDIPLSESDIYVITVIGDRLDSIAHQFYNDVRLWWIITAANPDVIRRDSYNLKPNLEIRIPTNLSPIIESFKEINK
jgi:nucleoid-associated protein YgaU